MERERRSRVHAGRRSAALLVAAALLLVSACGGDGNVSSVSPSATELSNAAAADADTYESRVRFHEQRAAADSLETYSLNSLAMEHMQRARETGDISLLGRAQTALDESLRRRPEGNYEALALAGSLKVTQHDFAAGLALADDAIALRPDAAFGYGVAGDAQLGLGRYDDAAASYAHMDEIEPGLSSNSRLANLAQVHGRTDEARLYWTEALALADGRAPEHEAYVRAQIAQLAFNEGDLVAAEREFVLALEALPGYVHALAGHGRVAGARGELQNAADWYEQAVARVPLPEYVIALGEVYEAAGRVEDAEQQYALVGAIEQLYGANGVSLDIQLVLFNADRGRDLAHTVERARALFAAQPSVQAADALAWALYGSGDYAAARDASAQALRTGIRDPLMLFHAGMIARAAGDEEAAMAHLRAVQNLNPSFSVRYADEASQALDELMATAAR